MSDWTEGYVGDLEYPGMFYAAQAPVHLNLACIIAGFEPVSLDGAFSYCELGCGQGVTTNLLAAANPNGRFYAVDFHPSHIARARETARAAGLDNVVFEERSFSELVSGPPAELPQFDFVTLHGIYSWMNPENRQAIVEFLRRCVKPGGIVYVSYNCMPGWSSGGPVQHLLHRLAGLRRERSDRRLQSALAAIEEIERAEFRHLAGNEFLARIRELNSQDATRYLVHDYLNDCWQPLYSAELASEFAAAKLSFTASADLFENFPELILTPEQRRIVTTLGDGSLGETLKDFALERPFRKDVFVRGARSLGDTRRDALLREMGFALTVPRAEVRLALEVPAGRATLQPRTYEPVFDALAERPHTIGELLQLPQLAGASTVKAVELAGMLASTGQALPTITGGTPEPARRFNRRLVAGLLAGETSRRYALAVPRLATGLSAGLLQLLVLAALSAGRERPDAVADHVHAALASRGEKMIRDGGLVEAEDECRRLVREEVGIVLRDLVPLWRKLDII
ncbi:MAG: methylase [Rhodospirillales bacterium]|nr:methylase [Rhodospirillales bacterium]